MECVIGAGDLARLCRRAGLALAAQAALPVLAGLELTVEGSGRLVARATDLVVEIAAAAEPLSGNREGRAVIPAARFADWVGQVPADQAVRLAVRDDGEAPRLVAASGAATARFPLFPEALPSLAEAWGGLAETVLVPADVFRRHAAWLFSAAPPKEAGQPILTGGHLAAAEGVLVAAATDRARLTQWSLPVDPSVTWEATWSPRSMQIAGGLLDEDTDTVAVAVTGALARIAGPDWVLTTRLLDGAYPDYRRVIPAEVEAGAAVDRGALAAAAGRLLALVDPRADALRVEWDGGALRLSVQGGAGSAGEERVPGDGQGVAARSVHPGWFLQAVRAYAGERLDLAAMAPVGQGPVRFQADGQPTHWLLPLRVIA
ncbi:MAG: hypothetical protein K6U87_06870 [Firmicutes bacterium]|nr:hypothetical protein [Bacillota bacterium]